MAVNDPKRDVASFVGRGFAFPMRIDEHGSLVLESGSNDIDKAIRVILSTAVGERPMRPAFGCRIWDQLFEPINPSTLGRMEDAVREALSQWEPRADVTEVRVTPAVSGIGAVDIAIDYTIRATNDRRNLVHPFYLIPGEGDDGGPA